MPRDNHLLSWLPAHQEHLVYSVAYCDSLIDRLAEVLLPYLEAGPFELEEVVSD